MTVIYFKKNGVCYSYDDADVTSTPPPGALVIDSATELFTDCDKCCPAPCVCPYTVASPQPTTITATISGTYKIYPKIGCEGPETILKPGTIATLTSFSACSWRGTTSGGDRVFNVEVKLVTNDLSNCRWEASVFNNSVIVAMPKVEGGSEIGDYGSAESICGSSSDKLIINSFVVSL